MPYPLTYDSFNTENHIYIVFFFRDSVFNLRATSTSVKQTIRKSTVTNASPIYKLKEKRNKMKLVTSRQENYRRGESTFFLLCLAPMKRKKMAYFFNLADCFCDRVMEKPLDCFESIVCQVLLFYLRYDLSSIMKS